MKRNGWLIGVTAAAIGSAAMAQPAKAPDPYLWLEQVNSPRAMAWVQTENNRSLGLLEKDARYPGLYADALKIAEATDKVPFPNQLGGQIVNFWQDAQHVRGIWRTTSPASYRTATPAWRTLIDLDALSSSEHANWVWHGTDCEPVDERRCLVTLSDGGEDADTQREFDVTTGKFVPGGFTLPTSKQSAAWEGSDSLLVSRDWGPGTATASGYPFVVKRLERGQPLAAAKEIFRGQPSDVGVNAISMADGAGHSVAMIMREVTFFETEQYVVVGDKAVALDVPKKNNLLGLVDGRLIFQVNDAWTPKGGAPIVTGSLVAVDPAGKAPPETIFSPGPRQSVDGASATKDRVLASVYDNVRGRAMSFARGANGWTATTLALPDNAAIDVASTDRTTDDAYLAVQSFLLPTSLWSVDAATGTVAQVKSTPPRFDAAGLVTEQHFATSKDGTKVPYFVVHRRDVPLNGSTPTLLNAYGGFQVSETPFYSGSTGKLWLERGGAFALANIRGGGEFGPAWHEAALKTKRQNAYDDFAAVAQDLIARKLTSPRRLGIYGGSNGGLLMGVELTQRPDLWNAVAIEVPLLDMLRYEKLSAGASRGWASTGPCRSRSERAFLAAHLAVQPASSADVAVSGAVDLDDHQGRSRRPRAGAQVCRADEGIRPALPLLGEHRGRPWRRRQSQGAGARQGARDHLFHATADGQGRTRRSGALKSSPFRGGGPPAQPVVEGYPTSEARHPTERWSTPPPLATRAVPLPLRGRMFVRQEREPNPPPLAYLYRPLCPMVRLADVACDG